MLFRCILLVLLVGCGGGLRVHGHIGTELQALVEEGWLSKIDSGECRPEWTEPPPRSEAPIRASVQDSAEGDEDFDYDEDDIIGDLMSTVDREPPTAECVAAGERFASLQREYAQAQGVVLQEANMSIQALAEDLTHADTSELCPIDDRGVFGAQLALIRTMAAFQRYNAPFIGSERRCRVPTLGGFVQVYRDESEFPYDGTVVGDYAPAYAADVFAQTCFRSVPGHEDGCVRRTHCGGPNQSPCQYPLPEGSPQEPGTIVMDILRPRSAMGCGSTGERMFVLRQVHGYWQVEQETIIAMGVHGQ